MKEFPVLNSRRWKSVDWSGLSERQAIANHSQTLERLAQRGGLCPKEIAGNFLAIDWCELGGISDADVKRVMEELNAKWKNYTKTVYFYRI